MRPVEIVTVVVSLPLIAALVAAEMADRAPPAPPQRSAEVNAPAPTFFDEIVVVAKRTTG